MEMDTWWRLVDTARVAVGDRADDRDDPDDPLPEALVNVLSELEPAEIVDFYAKHVEVSDLAYTYPLCMAAYLIEGSWSNDGFMDFRGGLILLGRDTFSRAVKNPDSLATVPTVVRMCREEGGWIGYESLSYLIEDAYQKSQGETDSFGAAVEAAVKRMARPGKPLGEEWDPENAEQIRLRLPLLAALSPVLD
ncbi:DUF4240 domain-containing protein [Streptomyces sp. NPDC004539]|uniref:DUF4240 domain-containing protein n=1 Tax=Streptomyces sp. NPDC004539 TaxID=3154280 RepID=UPI0033A924C8